MSVSDPNSSAPEAKRKRSSWRLSVQVLCGTTVLAAVVVGFFYLNHLSQSREMRKLSLDLARDYKALPFGMVDAVLYCRSETQEKYGDDLAMSYVDEHSTRKDSRTGIFKVFIIAHLGSAREYEETAVHCFVDPEKQMLTHYRAINLEKASLMSRAVKFFE